MMTFKFLFAAVILLFVSSSYVTAGPLDGSIQAVQGILNHSIPIFPPPGFPPIIPIVNKTVNLLKPIVTALTQVGTPLNRAIANVTLGELNLTQELLGIISPLVGSELVPPVTTLFTTLLNMLRAVNSLLSLLPIPYPLPLPLPPLPGV